MANNVAIIENIIIRIKYKYGTSIRAAVAVCFAQSDWFHLIFKLHHTEQVCSNFRSSGKNTMVVIIHYKAAHMPNPIPLPQKWKIW